MPRGKGSSSIGDRGQVMDKIAGRSPPQTARQSRGTVMSPTPPPPVNGLSAGPPSSPHSNTPSEEWSEDWHFTQPHSPPLSLRGGATGRQGTIGNLCVDHLVNRRGSLDWDDPLDPVFRMEGPSPALGVRTWPPPPNTRARHTRGRSHRQLSATMATRRSGFVSFRDDGEWGRNMDGAGSSTKRNAARVTMPKRSTRRPCFAGRTRKGFALQDLRNYARFDAVEHEGNAQEDKLRRDDEENRSSRPKPWHRGWPGRRTRRLGLCGRDARGHAQTIERTTRTPGRNAVVALSTSSCKGPLSRPRRHCGVEDQRKIRSSAESEMADGRSRGQFGRFMSPFASGRPPR